MTELTAQAIGILRTRCPHCGGNMIREYSEKLGHYDVCFLCGRGDDGPLPATPYTESPRAEAWAKGTEERISNRKMTIVTPAELHDYLAAHGPCLHRDLKAGLQRGMGFILSQEVKAGRIVATSLTNGLKLYSLPEDSDDAAAS